MTPLNLKSWSHVTCFTCTRETEREIQCYGFVSLSMCNLHVDLCGKLDVDRAEWKFDKIIDLSFNPQLCKFTCNQCRKATTCWSYHRSISGNRPLAAYPITCSIKACIICALKSTLIWATSQYIYECTQLHMCAEYMSKNTTISILLVNVAINISSFNAY